MAIEWSPPRVRTKRPFFADGFWLLHSAVVGVVARHEVGVRMYLAVVVDVVLEIFLQLVYES